MSRSLSFPRKRESHRYTKQTCMKTFWHKNKLLIAMLAFGVALTAYLYTPSYTYNENIEEGDSTKTTHQPSSVLDVHNEKTEKSIDKYVQKSATVQNQVVTKSTSTSQNITETQSKTITIENPIPVSLEIPALSYKAADSPLSDGSSVYDFMTVLSRTDGLVFSGKEFGNLGFFVESIGGIVNDKLKGKYWIYYVNGQKAKVGISQYIVQSSDIITWKYENQER